jgi:anti-sigma factor RsiW
MYATLGSELALPKHAPRAGLTCKEATRRATLFLEGRLHAADTAALEAHVASCASCQAYLDQIALVRDALRRLPSESPSQALRKMLRQAFVQNDPSKS